MKTAAGIVTYNPDLDRLSENIRSVKDQVDLIVFVDNASDNLTEIRTILPDNSILIENKKNRGVARALNQIFSCAGKMGAEWVLTLDQDSVCASGLVDEYRKYTGVQGTGILTCQIKDRNGLTLDLNADQEGDCAEISRCITSGAFCSMNAYAAAGGFVNPMFIDWVDYEYCANLRRHGFKICRINYEGLTHEVGHGQAVRLLGKCYQVHHHAPVRHYYLARNRLFVARLYPEEYSFRKELLRNMRDIVLVWFYEDKKLEKTCCILKGIADSRKLLRTR